MIEILQATPLFSQLSVDEIMPLVSDNQLYLKIYSKGATVYNQKIDSRRLILFFGSLVASLLDNGSAMTMFEFSRADFGANLLFGIPTYTVYNLHVDAQVCMSPRKRCRIIARLLFDAVYQMLSHNSQKLNRRITLATQKTSEKTFWNTSDSNLFYRTLRASLPVSKQLADYLGVQRPSLFRELKTFKDEGIIDISNRTIRLNHIQDLE